MKNILYKSFYAVACASIVFACKPKFEDQPAASAGSANFATYVAVGNSITAGYADGALYREGQESSYAKLLADQLKLAGGGEFKIPYVSPTTQGVGAPFVGPSGLVFPGPFVLAYVTDCKGVTSLGPKATAGDPTAFASVASQGLFNSIAVPGAKAIHVPFQGYGDDTHPIGTYNPFFSRFASDKAGASMLSDAMLKNPTFFSLFIGNNDVLLYALAGGPFSNNSITPTANFNASIDIILDSLTKHGAKGVIANIPDITSIPHFTTVPYYGLVVPDAPTAAYINAQLKANYPTVDSVNRTVYVGPNRFFVEDASVTPGGIRKMNPGELVLLSVPQDSIKCYGLGSFVPFKGQHFLNASEVADIKTHTADYNTKLQSAAIARDLAFVDANAFLKSAISGLTFNGVKVSSTFVSGGAFSLDGVHLTPLGNALLANEFIKSINAKFGATIPQVDPTKYRGVKFPN